MRTLFKGIRQYGLPLALCLGLLFMPDVTFANTAGDSNEALKNFAQIAASLVHIISAIAIIIIQFMPALWGSELITGDVVTDGLRTLWIYVRNLTNIAFVGVILYLALVNMISSGKGIKDWSIKTKLGKVILGLVAINFSLLGMKVVVDVVHVGTVALLSIADPVIEARGISSMADYYSRTVDTETFTDCDASAGGGDCKPVYELVNNTFCAGGIDGGSCLFKIKEVSKWRAKAEALGNPEKSNIMLAFGTFFMKLESLPLLSAESGGLLNVLDSTVFSIIFGLAYLLALIAIFIALIIRVVMMWIFIIFSPLLVGAAILGVGGGGASKFTDQFIGYLLLPLKAAAALAFGFVMLSALETMIVPSHLYVNIIEPGAPLKKFWGDESFGGWQMLWKVFTVVLFWKVVFDFALSGVEGVSGITDKIKGFGQAAGSAALTFGADQVKIPGLGVEGKETTLASFMGANNPTNMLQGMKRHMQQNSGSGLEGYSFAGAAAQNQNKQNLDSVIGKAGDTRNMNAVVTEMRRLNMTEESFTDAFNTDREKYTRELRTATGATNATTAAQFIDAIKAHDSRAFGSQSPTTTQTPTAPVELDSAGVQAAVETGITSAMSATAMKGLSADDFKAQINSQIEDHSTTERASLRSDDTRLNALAASLAGKNDNVSTADVLAYLQQQLG